MGNQLRALEAALAVARVLDRMLVVPDYIADNGEGDSCLCARSVDGVFWRLVNRAVKAERKFASIATEEARAPAFGCELTFMLL